MGAFIPYQKLVVCSRIKYGSVLQSTVVRFVYFSTFIDSQSGELGPMLIGFADDTKLDGIAY